MFTDATVVHVVQGRETGRFGPKIGVTVNFLPAPPQRRGHKHHLNEKLVKKWPASDFGVFLGSLGVFDGVPVELQMVPDGCNGPNGCSNGWIPLALGLLLFTDPIVVLLLLLTVTTLFSA